MRFDFDRVMKLTKMCRVLLFLQSSTPYIAKEMRDVGEVPVHNLESLRSLIIDVGMFFDLVNDVEKPFEIPLFKRNYTFIPFVLEVLCLFRHVVIRGQNVLFESNSDIFRRRKV